jgi:hypothetical protein
MNARASLPGRSPLEALCNPQAYCAGWTGELPRYITSSCPA